MENVLKKRKNTNVNMQFDSLFKKNNIKKVTLLNKFIFQVVFCIVILASIWLYKMVDPLTFEYNKSKYGWILQYNMTYENTYNNIARYFNNKFQFNIPLKNNIVIPSDTINAIDNTEFVIEDNLIKGNEIEQNTVINEEVPIKEIDAYNNMKVMAQDIKNKYKLIKPTTGQVTCPFGNRESDNQDISTFHLGIDIGNAIGTKIVAAMEGKVIEVAKNSVYGNYIKTQKDDVLIVYAHLNKALVKKGEEVEVGKEIGEMGKTGLATGVHLHFEVRKNGIVINPEYMIDFN